MSTKKSWPGEILIDEEDEGRRTSAQARLDTGGRAPLQARGTAKRNPQDENVPEIGDELAAARALSELAHKLLSTAANEIEQMTHERVNVHS